MGTPEDNLKPAPFPVTTTRNMSSSSSAFFSADQSPFFSPKSPSVALVSDPISSVEDEQKLDRLLSSTSVPSSTTNTSTYLINSDFHRLMREQRDSRKGNKTSITSVSASFSSSRLRSCDVFIGLHGRRPSLLQFATWLRSELEMHGMTCFVSDRSRCRKTRNNINSERAMEVSSYGVVLITKNSLKNHCTIQEIKYFSREKNLVPIFFDLSPDDCLVRDIVEKRGETWENHGGEMWHVYGGEQDEWKEAVSSLSRVDEWKLEAHDGNWRDCILRAVMLLGMRLGKRSVVESLSKYREKAEKFEFPFPRNENFIGRKKELSELELMLFGDTTDDYFELKGKTKSYKFGSTEERKPRRTRKGKESIIWRESMKEIEMQTHTKPVRSKRKRPASVAYGKGIACVSGEAGIGKTELLLEFAYRHHQKYKLVLWVSGESHYIRQNYLNLKFLMETDAPSENRGKVKIRSFEEQEDEAISSLRKEFMRNIPYLIIIDNLESECDWWDHRHVMDLLPRFGGETHIIVSTRLSKVMNLEPLKLSYLSAVEAMAVMQGTVQDYPNAEIDSLRVIEEKLGRSPLGIAIIGAILSELPISPSRLLDTINRMPVKEMTWANKNVFLLQLIEVCFSIFDHADGPKSLATRMVLASSYFAPCAVPVSLLSQAASRVPNKKTGTKMWRKCLSSVSCVFAETCKRSEAEACSMLIRFNIARSSTKENHICVSDVVRVYSRKRGIKSVAQAVVHSVITRGVFQQHGDHVWAAAFLLFGFIPDSKAVDVRVSDLLHFVKNLALPLAIQAFVTFSRCKAAVELLRLCTNALEMADQEFVTPVDKWMERSLCWRRIQTRAEMNPYLWQELALCRASVLEMRAKLMLRGGQFDGGDDLIRKAIFIRTNICGENHPDTISAKDTLNKLSRVVANVHSHASPLV